jgi:hypothetical protein
MLLVRVVLGLYKAHRIGMQKHLVKKAEIEPKTRTRSSSAPKMGEEGLMRILFMLIVYRGLPRDECDEILTSRRFFHTGFYTAKTAPS